MKQPPRRRPGVPAVPPRRIVKRTSTDTSSNEESNSEEHDDVHDHAEEEEEQAATPVASTATASASAVESSSASTDTNVKKETPKAATPPPTKNNKGEEQKSGGGGKTVLIILLLLAIGAAGYFAWEYTVISEILTETQAKLSAIEAEKNDEIANKEKQLQELLADYDNIKKERSALKLNNKGLNEEIAGLQATIEKLRAMRNNTNTDATAKAKFVKELDKTIAEHKLEIAKKDEEIERLKHINSKLSKHVDQLIEKQGEMSAQFHDLEDKVRIASIVNIENLEIAYIDLKGNINTDDYNEFKSKKIDKLRFGFSLAENHVAKKEDKLFTIRVLDPDSKVMFDLGQGGGTFKMSNGQNDFYTAQRYVKFDNEKEKVYFRYTQSKDYKPGKYRLEVYSEGFKVGEKEFNIF